MRGAGPRCAPHVPRWPWAAPPHGARHMGSTGSGHAAISGPAPGRAGNCQPFPRTRSARGRWPQAHSACVVPPPRHPEVPKGWGPLQYTVPPERDCTEKSVCEKENDGTRRALHVWGRTESGFILHFRIQGGCRS